MEVQISSNASSRETNLRNESQQQVQGWQTQIQQAEQGINNARQAFFTPFSWLNLGNNNQKRTWVSYNNPSIFVKKIKMY